MAVPQNGYVQLDFPGSNPTFNPQLLPFFGAISNVANTMGVAFANWSTFQLNVTAPQTVNVLVQRAAFTRDTGTQSMNTTGWIVARRVR